MYKGPKPEMSVLGTYHNQRVPKMPVLGTYHTQRVPEMPVLGTYRIFKTLKDYIL